MSKIDKYIEALKTLGDGRYHYYDGKPNGIGCSDYTRLALIQAGILNSNETFHAASGNIGALADTSRFKKIIWDPNVLQKGDILWSNYHHVATWDGNNGVYEAAPQNTHGICENGKTGVGHWPKHTYYNCGTGSYVWSYIYRIIDQSPKRTLFEQAEYMIKNNINGQARKNQAKIDGFTPEEVQEKIDLILAKNLQINIQSITKAMPVLKKGDSNNTVKLLQTELKNMGYLTSAIDGQFGSYTENALKAFQTNINKVYGNFPVDGICGEKTWTRLLQGK